jgi:adenylate cyclase
LILLGYFIIQPGDKSETGWRNSIAVLPFDNISNDPEQEYFCDGMTEQVISNLGRLHDLKVIARQSVMKYKDSEKTVPEIGKDLKVAHVLESSIRKSGDRIRVTAQLIKTDDGFHLWSQDFDRTLDDIFNIQDDISEKIAKALLKTLSPEEKKGIKTNRPSSIEAYEYYMKGRHLHLYKYYYSRDKEHFVSAERMLKTAIKLDPSFADSYASLADLYNTHYNYVPDIKTERKKYMILQETYLDTAYGLDPNSAEVNNAKGWIHDTKTELTEAFLCFKSAIKTNPNHSEYYISLATFYARRGCLRLAMKICTKALEINPLDYQPYRMRGRYHMGLGELKEAESDIKKALELDPNEFVKRACFYIYVFKKQYVDAQKYLNQLKIEYPEKPYNYRQALLHAINGQKDKALNIPKSNNWLYNTIIFSLLDMKEDALGVVQNRLEYHKENEMSRYLVLKDHPWLENMRSHPRFLGILAKHKELYEENLAKYGDIDI